MGGPPVSKFLLDWKRRLFHRGGNQLQREAEQSPPNSGKFKINGATPPFPRYVSMGDIGTLLPSLPL